MHTYAQPVEFCRWYPSGPRSTFTEYALPTGRGLTCGRRMLVDFEGASLFALVRRFSTSNLEIVRVARRFRAFAEHRFGHSQTAEAAGFNARSYARRGRVPRTSTRLRGQSAAPRRAVECPQNPTRQLECVGLVAPLVPLQKHPEKPAEV